MGKRLPFILSTIGILFLAGSFVYDIAFIDLPSRDLPPDSGKVGNHIALTAWLRTIGLFSLIIGGFLFLTRAVIGRRPKK